MPTDASSITRTAMSAATDSPKKSKSKPSKEKKSQGKSQNERLKVVVRRLPPNLPEEIFWQSVSDWVSDETVSWKSFHAGKVRKRWALVLGRSTFTYWDLTRVWRQAEQGDYLVSSVSCVQNRGTARTVWSILRRACLQGQGWYVTYFFHIIAVLTFHIGNETQVVVELAPYQKVPTEKSKADNRIATIEEGIPHDTRAPHYVIYTKTTQMKITCHSSSRWRTTIQNHLTRKHSNT